MEGKSTENFHLEQCAAILFESGKKLGQAALLFYGFVFLTTVVVFSENIKSDINVPFLNLQFDRQVASLLLLVLCCATWYKFRASNAYERILSEKMQQLVRNMGDDFYPWYLYYPSLDGFHCYAQFLGKGGRAISWIVHWANLAAGYALPILFAIKIGITGFNVGWVLSIVVSALILFASAAIDGLVPFFYKKQEINSIISKLESRG